MFGQTEKCAYTCNVTRRGAEGLRDRLRRPPYALYMCEPHVGIGMLSHLLTHSIHGLRGGRTPPAAEYGGGGIKEAGKIATHDVWGVRLPPPLHYPLQ